MKQSIDFDDLGNTQKRYESITTNYRLMPNAPIIARMDGRAFHTLTRNANKPFDYNIIYAMRNTAKELAKEYNADLAYCQSDEITLAWKKLDMFDLKIQKLCSSLSASTSVIFYKEITKTDFDIDDTIPTFDCRIWNMPNLEEVTMNLLWRQWDAYKNSVSMVAHSMFSNTQLHGLNTKNKIELLAENGFDWHSLESHLKRGSFFKKFKVEMYLTDEELSKIPELYRPSGPVIRSIIDEFEVGSLMQVEDKVALLFP